MKGLTPEEFVEATNNLSMKMIELGVSVTDVVDELAGFILPKCDGTAFDDEEANRRCSEIYDSFFTKQIELYYMGCDQFLWMYEEYYKKINEAPVLADLDEITEKCEDTQSVIIDSTTFLIATLREFTLAKIDFPEGEPDLEFRIRALLNSYCESSFMLGLTDAQRVNYSKYTAKGLDPRRFWTMLSEVFQGIFKTPLDSGEK